MTTDDNVTRFPKAPSWRGTFRPGIKRRLTLRDEWELKRLELRRAASDYAHHVGRRAAIVELRMILKGLENEQGNRNTD